MIYYLSLGSNLGDREGNINKAIEELKKRVKVTRSSPLHETEPWGYEDQPKFLNGAVKVETDLGPSSMLKLLNEIERMVGRKKRIKWGPRVIDIDIVVAFDGEGNEIMVDSPTLKIPHELAEKRDFMLLPLKDIEPELILKSYPLDYWLSKTSSKPR